MSIWPVLAKHSKHARLPRVLLLFAGMQILLFIPVAYALLSTQPYDMFARLNDNVTVAGENFQITGSEIVFASGKTVMAATRDSVPDSVINAGDYNELFNYIALYNGYFTNIYIPVALVVFAGFLATQALFYVCAAWLFGQTRIITTYMTIGERFKVAVIASLPAVLPGALIGFIAPLVHVLLFEVAVVYLAYKTIGEY
jgi:hypothetical protein